MMNGWGMGMAGWGWLGMAFFWILVIAAAVYLVKVFSEQSQNQKREGNRQSDRAIEILRERYAKGDIDQEEFTKRKRELGG
jgi:putative membrane protein